MSGSPFRVELFDKRLHDRSEFDCGVAELNDYFRSRLSQDVRRKVTVCYVAVDNATDLVAGYYTLAMGSVSLKELPKQTAKRLPRYPNVPVVLIGRLAVHLNHRGQRLGSGLLVDAIRRTIDSGVASFAAVVHAKDDDAVAFYEHHGFIKFGKDAKTLFLPISDALRQEYGPQSES